MGTNYYFRKKTVDPIRIEAIVDSLNNDYKSLVAKYNEKLHEELSAMGIDSILEFDDYHTFISPVDSDTYGDIHVGKLSVGWKPLLKANGHFNSVSALKQWYEQNKHEYNFIDEYDEVASFKEFITEIERRNKDDTQKGHPNKHGADGYDWEYSIFC